MYAPKVATLLAVLAGVASAAPTADAFNPTGKTSFKLSDVNITDGAGCAVLVSTEHGDGCQGVAVLNGGKNCDQIKEFSHGPVCNGTVSVDFSKTPAFASYATWEYLAYCDIKDDGCLNKY
jgi:hypothetical protein